VLSLSVDPADKPRARGRSADLGFRTHFSTRIAWSGRSQSFTRTPLAWHELALAWSPTNTLLVVDGLQMQGLVEQTDQWPARRPPGAGIRRSRSQTRH